MKLLHCVETQGLNGAKDTVNCVTTGNAWWLIALLIFVAVVATITLALTIYLVVGSSRSTD